MCNWENFHSIRIDFYEEIINQTNWYSWQDVLSKEKKISVSNRKCLSKIYFFLIWSVKNSLRVKENGWNSNRRSVLFQRERNRLNEYVDIRDENVSNSSFRSCWGGYYIYHWEMKDVYSHLQCRHSNRFLSFLSNGKLEDKKDRILIRDIEKRTMLN